MKVELEPFWRATCFQEATVQLEKTLKRICSICEKRAELAQRDSELTNGTCGFFTRGVLVRGGEVVSVAFSLFPPRRSGGGDGVFHSQRFGWGERDIRGNGSPVPFLSV